MPASLSSSSVKERPRSSKALPSRKSADDSSASFPALAPIPLGLPFTARPVREAGSLVSGLIHSTLYQMLAVHAVGLAELAACPPRIRPCLCGCGWPGAFGSW